MATYLTVLLLAGVLLLGLAGGGCGGSDDSNASGDTVSVTTSSLSKKQFLEKANSICRRERVKVIGRTIAFEKQNPKRENESSAERFADQLKFAMLPTIEAEIEKVQKVGAPSGDEEEVARLLTAQQEAVDKSKELQEVRYPDGLQKYFSGPADQMERYGLASCSLVFTLSPANAAAAEPKSSGAGS